MDIGGNAHYDAFDYEAKHWKQALGEDVENVERYSSGSSGWGIEVRRIDPDDIDGERRLLQEFVERVNRRAEPEQAKLDEANRQKRAEAEARAARARDLTDRFRDT